MLALSLKNTKVKEVTDEKYGEQKVINLGPSTGKHPRFNVDIGGVPHTMLILPQPNEEGDGWHYKGILSPVKGAKEVSTPKPPKPETFNTASVAKTTEGDARLAALEAGQAAIMAALAKLTK